MSEAEPAATNRAAVLSVLPRAIASVLYGIGARAHRAQARWTRPARGRPACAVMSVGGLTIGGAGKTPVAAALARALHLRGRRVVLASRGYRGRARDPVTVVSDGRHVLSAVRVSGDESLILAAHAPGVPVLVGRDRRVVGHHAVSCFDAEVLILDDGFQHHRLARDLDLVCIDGASGFGNRHVVPWGPLREPIGALSHANWLCIVDGGSQEKEAELVESFAAGGGRVLRAHRRPGELVSLDRRHREKAQALAGRSVGLVAGIARPGSLRRSLEGLDARVVAERIFPDHHTYRESDLATLDPDVPEWVTTEKDAIKILPEWLGDTKLSVLGIDVEFEDERPAIDAIEARLFGSNSLESVA